MRLLSNELNLRLVRLLLRTFISSRIRARGLLRWSRQWGKEVNSLPNSLDRELLQLIDRRLSGSYHILQPLGVAHQLPQVGTIVSFDGHWFFPRTMLRNLLSMGVVQVLLIVLFLDEIGRRWWQVGVLSVRPGFSCHFGW